MGTRSLTVINDAWDNEEICVLYRQYDGYPEGHGKDLLDFLKGINVVNGINSDSDGKKISNGMDCLAAQMFAYFKTEAGGIYCMHPDAEDCWEEFIYEISEGKDRQIFITVYEIYNDSKMVFHGTPEELLTKIEEKEYA